MEKKNGTISVKDAKKLFTDIMDSLRLVDRQAFLSFIADEWNPEQAESESQRRADHGGSDQQEDQLKNIKRIVIDIRKRVPYDAIFLSERVIPPTNGENSDCDSKSTKHVDAFLYDNKEVDELIEEGKLETLYCSNCGSEDIKEYNIISHSMSVPAILYVFHSVLPCLKGKSVLDVGSRLGAVLYGTYIFTLAKRVIGVEMNKELCDLQCDVIKKYQMNDRIEIVNKRIEDCPEMVRNSDVIIMNNPFEFYVSESTHIEIWKFLRANIQKGTILVTRPGLETTLKNLETGIKINQWVKSYRSEKKYEQSLVFASSLLDHDEYCNIRFYEVL